MIDFEFSLVFLLNGIKSEITYPIKIPYPVIISQFDVNGQFPLTQPTNFQYKNPPMPPIIENIDLIIIFLFTLIKIRLLIS